MPDSPVPVPQYLESAYWWAYVRPGAIRFFERDWLVNTILFGNYARLRDAALQALASPLTGHILQVACVYGNLTQRLQERLAADARLDVVDVVPHQLENLRRKLPPDARTRTMLADSTALPHADASIDQLLLFFLLHEQPAEVRRATLAEAVRVLRPGGRLVIMDYHKPCACNPIQPLMRLVFATLEPFAMDLWRAPVDAYLPTPASVTKVHEQHLFGGLYQLQVWQRTVS